jgi:hypothetical protein
MGNKWWAKLLRIVGIVLMSLTAAFTLMGGAGTACVALDPTGFEGKFAGLAPFQWLYILYVLVTIGIGILGVRAVVLLCKGARHAYREALIALLSGMVVGILHILSSRLLRGGSMPVDMVVYVTALTLILFLLFRIPGIWQGVNFEKPAGGKKTGRNASAIATAAAGLLALTVQFVMAPTHTIGGINYADIWHAALTAIGAALIACGIGIATFGRFSPARRALPEAE